jgi:hypothetical protein
MQVYKIAYLVIFHTDIQQLRNLISKISDDEVKIFLHIYYKARNININDIIEEFNITVVNKKINVRWGTFSQIESNLVGIRTIINSGIKFNHLFILSGTDYPLIKNAELFEYLEKYSDTSFIHYDDFFNNESLVLRVLNYHFFLPFNKKIEYPYIGNNIFKKMINSILKYSGLIKFPKDLSLFPTIYFGSNWVKLSYKATLFLNDYVAKSPKELSFFKSTMNPDEIFYQTIFLNSTIEERGEIINNNLLYTHWDRPEELYPNPLDLEDFERFNLKTKFFARKFHSKISKPLIDKINDELLSIRI